MALDQSQRDRGRVMRGVGGVEHLVADGLDDPATLLGDDRQRPGLELVDQPGELLLAQRPALPGVADDVGEADSLLGGIVVAGGRGEQQSGGRVEHVAPPDVALHLLDQRNDLGDHLGHLVQVHLPRIDGLPKQVQLPLGEPGEAAPQRPDHRALVVIVDEAELVQPLGQPHRLEVACGEGDLVVVDGGEPQRAPPPPGGLHVDADVLGDLRTGECGPAAQEIDLQQVDELLRVGLLPVVLGHHASTPPWLSITRTS